MASRPRLGLESAAPAADADYLATVRALLDAGAQPIMPSDPD